MTFFSPPFPPSALFAAGDGGTQQNQNREQAIKMRSAALRGTQRAQPALEPALCVTSQLYINSVQALSNFQVFFFSLH